VTYQNSLVVERDTLGDFDGGWLRSRASDQQSPVCLQRNTQMRISARLDVTQRPTDDETVNVRATATVGGTALTWTWNAVAVAHNANMVTLPQADSDNTIPDQVGRYENVDITWSMQDAAGNWVQVGTSRTTVYAILGASLLANNYWTVLDVSCRAAHGQNAAGAVVAAIFTAFQARNIRRKRDGRQLTYWNPNTTNATNTQEMLQRPDGSGQCGAWAELLRDMCRVHGIADAHKVVVTVPAALRVALGNQATFLVKNWRFDTPPAPSGTALTHQYGVNCRRQPGVAGQGNANPPAAFQNHFIVLYTPTGRFYDPSYGTSAVDQTAWEAAAIDGLSHETAGPQDTGYKRSLRLANLLHYRDQTANVDL
jgi:hypothetical protein